MTTDTRKLGPTLTLAQLYESQQQYLDALAIYRRLHQERGSQEAADKVAELDERILSEKTLSYDKIITQIFSREELRQFKVLPHDRHEAWRKASAESEPEDADIETLAEEEPLPDPTPAPPVDAGPHPASSATAEDTLPTEEPQPEPLPVLNITLGQFIERLKELGDADTPLGEIPLGELLAAICRGGR